MARLGGVPVATAHRQITTLVGERYLSKLSNGHYVAGPRLIALLGLVDVKQVLVNTAAPLLHQLAQETCCVVQLGTFENDMVTYRIKTGHGAPGLFTKVDMQLEAYCTGIGKVLLAWLPRAERDAYLANGPFPRMTDHTICDAEALSQELDRVQARGFATDREEMAVGLSCVAVPVRKPDGSVPAAISASGLDMSVVDQTSVSTALLEVAGQIERLAFY